LTHRDLSDVDSPLIRTIRSGSAISENGSYQSRYHSNAECFQLSELLVSGERLQIQPDIQ